MHGQAHYPFTGRLSDGCMATTDAEAVLATESWLLTEQCGVVDRSGNPLILERGLHCSPLLYLHGVLGVHARIARR